MSPSQQLPSSPNLRQLRNQAKDLHKEGVAELQALYLNRNSEYGGNIMNFTPIDFTSWPRGQYFNVHFNIVPNTYSMTVNHAVCDGFHVPRFLNELQSMADSLIST